MTRQERTERAQDRSEDGRHLPAGVARRLIWTRAVLLWEELWPALWPLLGLLGLYAVLALLGVMARLPFWLHLAVLVAFAAGLAWSLWRGLRRLRLPDRRAAMRRLEASSGLAHHPFAALEDDLASGAEDPGAARLWALHRERARAALAHLRAPWPRPELARHDPLALRHALLLLLIIGIVGAGPDWRARLGGALRLDWPEAAAMPVRLEGWITPPGYTGVAPVYLAQTVAAEPVTVPAASVLTLRLQGGSSPPRLRREGAGAQAELPFEQVEAGNFALDHELASDQRLEVIQDGRVLAAWQVVALADAPPAVDFSGQPRATETLALQLPFAARDDYGIAAVRLEMRRKDDAVDVLALGLPQAGAREIRTTAYRDLTSHRWAGLPVTLTLVAEDGIGQRGTGAPLQMVLPARRFSHPVAQAIIATRKRLAETGVSESAARALRDLTRQPEAYDGDVVVHLGLRIASERLLALGGQPAPEEMFALLWDLALRLEDDGLLALAQQELRQAQEALQQALAQGAKPAEIDRLMAEMERALSSFMSALAEQAMREALKNGLPPLDPNATVVSRDQIQDLLRRAHEMMRMGNQAAAQQILAQLQHMLENIRMGLRPTPADPAETAMRNTLQDLSEIMGEQQKLTDQTIQRDQGPPDQAANATASQMQEGLRRRLGEAMRRLGEEAGGIPKALGGAERAMHAAREALGEDRMGHALSHQQKALDQLHAGAQEIAGRLQARQRARNGIGRFGPPTDGSDPLGRPLPTSGPDYGERDQVPDEIDAQRSRRILEELQRRAADRRRPVEELDYLERLLRRF